MFKKTLTAIIAATALFGSNVNSFAQTDSVIIVNSQEQVKDGNPVFIEECCEQPTWCFTVCPWY